MHVFSAEFGKKQTVFARVVLDCLVLAGSDNTGPLRRLTGLLVVRVVVNGLVVARPALEDATEEHGKHSSCTRRSSLVPHAVRDRLTGF